MIAGRADDDDEVGEVQKIEDLGDERAAEGV